MEVTSFYEPESSTWTYLLADTTSRIALIIDPVWPIIEYGCLGERLVACLELGALFEYRLVTTLLRA